MSRQLDQAEEEQNSLDSVIAGSLKGFGATFSAAYLAWLLRMGPLLLSVFTAMPMWTRFDPLPVVLAVREDELEDEQDEQEAAAARILDKGNSNPSTDTGGQSS